MSKCQKNDVNEQFVRDLTNIVSKSLLDLGDRKKQLPWFVASAYTNNSVAGSKLKKSA
jgi:hypothetical protein